MWGGGGGGGGAEVEEGRKEICERGEGRAAQKTMAMGGGSRRYDGVDRDRHRRLICDETRKARGESLLGLAAPLNDVDECIHLAYSPSPSPPSCSLFPDLLRKESPR